MNWCHARLSDVPWAGPVRNSYCDKGMWRCSPFAPQRLLFEKGDRDESFDQQAITFGAHF
jgi:hypothetical protein